MQTGGPGGLEITGSEAALYQQPGGGFAIAAPRQHPQPVPEGQARPTRVDRLIAAIEGAIGADELGADLACAADAVAIVEACYESSRTGRWVDVPSV